MNKKIISTTIATGLLLAPMALGMVANQAPANVAHAATTATTSKMAKTQSANALAAWTANTPSHIKAQMQSQAINPANATNADFTIQWGDTLWGISQATDISVAKLASDNRIANPALIIAGAKLTLNGSAKAQAFVDNAQGQTAGTDAAATSATNTGDNAGSTAAQGSTVAANTTAAGQTTGAVTNAATNGNGATTAANGTEAAGSGVVVNPSTDNKGQETNGSGTNAGNGGAVTPSNNNGVNTNNGNGSGSGSTTPSTPSQDNNSGSSSSNSKSGSGSQNSGSDNSGSNTNPSTRSNPSTPSKGSGDDNNTPSTPTAEYADVTVKAVTSDGTVLKTATISHQKVGTSVTAQASSVAVSGYDLSDSSSKSATVTSNGTVITFTFKKQAAPAPVDNIYYPNADNIKELLMQRINVAANGKQWNPNVIGSDQTMNAFGYLTSDEAVVNMLMRTFDDSALKNPDFTEANVHVTATGSADPLHPSAATIKVHVTITWE